MTILFIFGLFVNEIFTDNTRQRPLRYTDCTRGGDQGDENFVKYLVTPDFPGLLSELVTCKWT
jgi:hypothetical protein